MAEKKKKQPTTAKKPIKKILVKKKVAPKKNTDKPKKVVSAVTKKESKTTLPNNETFHDSPKQRPGWIIITSGVAVIFAAATYGIIGKSTYDQPVVARTVPTKISVLSEQGVEVALTPTVQRSTRVIDFNPKVGNFKDVEAEFLRQQQLIRDVLKDFAGFEKRMHTQVIDISEQVERLNHTSEVGASSFTQQLQMQRGQFAALLAMVVSGLGQSEVSSAQLGNLHLMARQDEGLSFLLQDLEQLTKSVNDSNVIRPALLLLQVDQIIKLGAPKIIEETGDLSNASWFENVKTSVSDWVEVNKVSELRSRSWEIAMDELKQLIAVNEFGSAEKLIRNNRELTKDPRLAPIAAKLRVGSGQQQSVRNLISALAGLLAEPLPLR